MITTIPRADLLGYIVQREEWQAYNRPIVLCMNGGTPVATARRVATLHEWRV